MTVKSTKTKRNPFRIQKMANEIRLPIEEIISILMRKSNGAPRVSRDKLKHSSLREAKEACKKFPSDSEDFLKALEDLEQLALVKVETASNLSIMKEVLSFCPKGKEAERRIIKKLAYSFGFNGNLNNLS